ncbi:hypothetical protein Y032_0498g2518 [Ancylostoma ceylanicum]|uniref:Uncharacterized protein n=1 Tax=Ancylostoma ceylanicum TaxID=53326 RepID=A0A016WW53_9BILA|nr:hypothetical protein Y032_0498g2518 [Ancylostoma ceylanicum]
MARIHKRMTKQNQASESTFAFCVSWSYTVYMLTNDANQRWFAWFCLVNPNPGCPLMRFLFGVSLRKRSFINVRCIIIINLSDVNGHVRLIFCTTQLTAGEHFFEQLK